MKKLILALVLLLIIIPAQAQDETPEKHLLLEMLALVPGGDTGMSDWIVYTDIRAAETARHIETPTSWDAFLEQNDSPWLNSFMPGFPRKFSFAGISMWPEMVGFDVVAIDQTLTFGSDNVILNGDFSTETIDAALIARNYEKAEDNTVTLWCSIDGCDQGAVIDPDVEISDPFGVEGSANPFGQHPGRREPIALMSGYLMNSVSDVILNTMIDTADSPDTSILNSNRYRSAANYMCHQDGLLRQAIFLNLAPILYADPITVFIPAINAGDMTSDELITHLTEYFGDAGNLPLYDLVAFADIVVDGKAQSQIILVYPDTNYASQAVDVLNSRLPKAYSVQWEKNLVEVLADTGAELLPLEIAEDEETGFALVIITFESDIPDNEKDNAGQFKSSNAVSALIYSEFSNNDMIWLMPGEIRIYD